MKPLTKLSIQTATIIALSITLGLIFNATRPGGLPLAHAQASAVQIDTQSGEISLKDATVLFLSKKAVFVDAREADIFAEGHIQDALSMPLDYADQDFPKFKAQLEGKIVITYCDGELCHLSHDLAEKLKAKGVKDVLVLKNGWTLWKNENLPTATGKN